MVKCPDYTLLKEGKSIAIVEAKNLSVNLMEPKVINQLSHYCYNQGIHFGILTNGFRWLLFRTFQENPQDRIVWQVDLEKESIDSISRKLSSFSYDDIDKLANLIQASKVLEESWNELITSTDSFVNIVAQKLGEHLRRKNKGMEITQEEIWSFTQGRLSEYFGIAELENEDNLSQGSINKAETQFSEVEENVFKKGREKLKVIFPDNVIIYHNNVAKTFSQTIEKLGCENVKELNLMYSTVPLISEIKHRVYQQHKVGKYWIMVNVSTPDKFRILNDINQKLRSGLKIERI